MNASSYNLVSFCTETCLVNWKVFQVNALYLWICDTIHLKEKRNTVLSVPTCVLRMYKCKIQYLALMN